MATVTITIEADRYSRTSHSADDEAEALARCLYKLAELSDSGQIAEIADVVYRLMNRDATADAVRRAMRDNPR
ncbi:hypothetical protein ABZ814_22660 [Micromonospora musae]|uniref:hypothetical protein n=1 Tax=Micromonospora musae TaxID=1894970 RepID=UPI0033C88EFA